MGRDTVQLETAVNTISQEYLLEFTSEYGIPEALHPELPGPEDRIVDFSEGKVGVYTKFFEFANFRLPLSQFLSDILGYYQIHLSQLSVIGAAKVSHFEINCRVLNIIPTLSLFRVFYTPSFNSGCMSFSKRPGKNTPSAIPSPWTLSKTGTAFSGWTSAPKDGMPAENTYSAEAVRTLDTHHMDLFSLIRAPNPTKVKTGSRPRAAHEVPLLTVTANRVIEMEDPAAATNSSGVPSTIERSPLDFATEAGAKDQGTVAPKVPPPEDVPTTRGAPEAGPAERVAATDPSAVKESRKRGHDGVDANAPPKVLRKDHADPRPTGSTLGGEISRCYRAGNGIYSPCSCARKRTRGRDPESENASFASVVGSPESIYRPEWGIANGTMLDTPEACQDLVDHVAPPSYFSELRHLHNNEFLRQYNVNLARQVAMGSQLRLRFEQEAKLLKKSVAQVARRDKRIQAREQEIKNLEALLEAEADMKKAAEDKSAKRSQELENMWALFLDLQVSNDYLSQQVATLQEQVSEEEKLKAAFEEFKQYEDNRAFADVVSAGIAKGMSEGLRHGVEHGQTQLDLEALEAYDPEAEAKYIAALQVLKNLKYSLMDQLEGLKDTPMDVIMAALYLESDTRDDALQWVRELRPSSSQLTIPVYPEVHDHLNPWACKEEMLLADAIVANVSRAKKKKCRVVCRTHGVGSAHHARSDGVPVSVPTVIPQGLAILLADAATQTESNEAFQLPRSSSLPTMHS
nr:hypothetical protein [Tanacetum cinerariifolium]